MSSSEDNTSNDLSEDNTSEEELQAVDTKKLKENVELYFEANNNIKHMKQQLKELVSKKNDYEKYIRMYLDATKKDRIETKNGNIVYKQSSSRSPLKEELIEKVIVSSLHDNNNITDNEEFAHNIINGVNELRETRTKKNIKIVTKKSK